mgnify:FL=1
MKTLRLFFVCGVLSQMLALSAFAQQFMLSGKVSDSSGEGLPYVSIYIEGTGRGTASNSEGVYNIEASEGQTVVYQFIGYEKQKRKVQLHDLV